MDVEENAFAVLLNGLVVLVVSCSIKVMAHVSAPDHWLYTAFSAKIAAPPKEQVTRAFEVLPLAEK